MISSRATLSPNSLTSSRVQFPFGSLLYKRSALDKRACTADMRVLSAGPAASWTGLMRSGSMGFVELGVRCGSHVETGRSYHGVEGSP